MTAWKILKHPGTLENDFEAGYIKPPLPLPPVRTKREKKNILLSHRRLHTVMETAGGGRVDTSSARGREREREGHFLMDG